MTVRVEPNRDGSHVLWSLRCDDGTTCHGFATSRLEGMQKATAFIEATARAAAFAAGPIPVGENVTPIRPVAAEDDP